MNYETKYEIGQEITLKLSICAIDDDDQNDSYSVALTTGSDFKLWVKPSEIEKYLVKTKEEDKLKILEKIFELQSKLKELEETN